MWRHYGLRLEACFEFEQSGMELKTTAAYCVLDEMQENFLILPYKKTVANSKTRASLFCLRNMAQTQCAIQSMFHCVYTLYEPIRNRLSDGSRRTLR